MENMKYMINGKKQNFTIEDAKKLWELSLGGIDNMAVSIKPQAELGESSKLNIKPSSTKLVGDAEELPDANLKIVKILGRGGMGIVYRADQLSLGRNVAVKMLLDNFTGNERVYDKFVREAAVTAHLDHPNVVTVHDLGLDESGQVFYVMKEVKGGNWETSMSSRPLRDNLEILIKVCDAVAFAHSKGIIHRDIKPENIMLGDFGEVIVMDWGLAASLLKGDEPLAEKLSVNANPCGTPAFMSPEMAACDAAKIGFASDIYLLGGVLFQIASGKKPHGGQSVFMCLSNAMNNIIQDTESDSELIKIAKRAMAAEPGDRYPSVLDFQKAIKDYLTHETSVKMSEIAVHDLKKAVQSKDYDHFSQAIFGFRKSLEIWPGNSVAKNELPKAILRYAESAGAKGDYDLAISCLERENSAHAKIIASLERRRRIRDNAWKTLRFLSYASAVCIIGEILLAYMYYFGSLRPPDILPADEMKLESFIQESNRNLLEMREKLKELATIRYGLYVKYPNTISDLKTPNSSVRDKYNELLFLSNLLIESGMKKEAAGILEAIEAFPEKSWIFRRLKYLSSDKPFVEQYPLAADLKLNDVSADKTFSTFLGIVAK